MTKFIGGFADGKVLGLGRAPHFLRVTQTADGKVDGLDCLEDEVFPEESVLVYVLASNDGGAFVDGRDPKTGKRFGKFMVAATYELSQVQPSDEIVRDNSAWRKWCREQTVGSLEAE